ncbi:hypothetical protein DFQ29_000678 [Apophysomyces sp. BC1021]|nr:hypothetical protein DFQ29_000678 [Apophysomyces sp. BC1021]
MTLRTSLDEKNRTKMTTKYLLAVLYGVTACCLQGTPVLEDPYEVTGDVGQDGNTHIPRMARLCLARQQPKLFSSLCVCFFGQLEGGKKTRDDLETMICVGGGQVIEIDDVSLPFHGEIICSAKTAKTKIRQIRQKYGKQPVLASWIIRSISVYTLLDKHEFLCCD